MGSGSGRGSPEIDWKWPDVVMEVARYGTSSGRRRDRKWLEVVDRKWPEVGWDKLEFRKVLEISTHNSYGLFFCWKNWNNEQTARHSLKL